MSSKDGKFGTLIPVVSKFLYVNQITVMAGGPYAGKSRFSLKLAIALATGETTSLGTYPPTRILYCSERDWDFTTEQLKTIGIEALPPNIKIFCVPDIPTEQVAEFETDPLAYVAKHYFTTDFHPQIVLFDTLPYFQSTSAQFDISSYGLNRRDLLKMKRWAGKHHLSVFALCHSPKQNERNKYDDPFDKVIGSTAILASTVAAAVIERLNDHFVRIHFRSHVGELETPRYFRYKDFSECLSGEALCDDTIAAPVPLGKRQAEVLALIPMEFTPFAELLEHVAELLDTTENNVRNLIADLAKKDQVSIDQDPHTESKIIKRLKAS